MLRQNSHSTANSTSRKPVIQTPVRLISQFTTAMPALPPKPLWNTVWAPANEPVKAQIQLSRKAPLRQAASHLKMRRPCAFLISSHADAIQSRTMMGITPSPKLL